MNVRTVAKGPRGPVYRDFGHTLISVQNALSIARIALRDGEDIAVEIEGKPGPEVPRFCPECGYRLLGDECLTCDLEAS